MIQMFYEQSQKVVELKHRLQSFMDRHVYPNEERFFQRGRGTRARGKSIRSSRS